MSEKVKKRFIAGATCPKCKEMDTMGLVKEHGVETVTCVSCGHQMSQPEEHVVQEVRPNEQVIGIFKQE
ncbi:YheV family putative metal-binding protein [Colwellia sp. 6M3]|nr:YheV family putative zinc ribbon protein [Colwellia sp. 6M3]MBA6415420.1 YheV family putative metal-binding protein [Colwellia sp. 6M3]